jgi:hypothetical protein
LSVFCLTGANLTGAYLTGALLLSTPFHLLLSTLSLLPTLWPIKYL